MEPVQPPNPHGTPFLRILALLAFALVIVVLSSLGTYWYISNQTQQPIQQSQQVYQPAPTGIPTIAITPSANLIPNESPENFLQRFEKTLGVDVSLQSNNNAWVEGSSNAVLVGKSFDIGTFQNNFMAKYQNPSDPSGHGITEADLSNLKNKVDVFFNQNKFSKNDLNSRTPQITRDPTTVAYEKGDLKCLNTLSLNDPIGYFYCGTNDKALTDVANQLAASLKPTGNSSINITVQKLEGDYAMGGAGGSGGGTGWFAVKQNNQWKVVLKTQNIPQCSIMQQYNFPKDFYSDGCS